jgi:asparagine synthase (glutamine-hydrolysing)
VTALAGYWDFGDSADPGAECARMLRAQQIYAPDPPVCRTDGARAFGRRLFRLLPEDAFDRGPVVTGNTMLVADLRLDNRGELAAALGIAADEAKGLSDAAMLMRALERWQLGALDRITGDYAFAWWNGSHLVLARDIIGHRPLYYHRSASFFAFATMAKGLHALAAIPIAPNSQVAAHFLALTPTAEPAHFFEGVERVQPGHCVIVTPDGVASRRYWNPSPRTLRLSRPEDYQEALREHLDRAVAAQLRGGEDRVAAQLSGGLDSSAVAATAAKLLAATGGRVTAFTSVPRPGYEGGLRNCISDEGPLAASVAALHPNMDYVPISAGGISPLASLDRNYLLYEMPILNLCNAVWSHAIFDAARQRRLTIMLTGALGNMSFSYDGMHLLSALLSQGRLYRLAKEVALLLRSGTRPGTIAAQAIGPFMPVRLWKAISRLRGKANDLSAYSAINPDCAAARDIEARAAAGSVDPSYRPRAGAFESRLWAIDRSDPGNYWKGALGGWGIDLRDPTADRRLLEFCLSVPAEQYLAGGLPRALARRALVDRLPQAVLRERRKGYQAADWHEGLSAARDALREEVARLASIPMVADTLDTKRMAALIEDWPDGRWHDDRTTASYRQALLRGISTGHFMRKAAGANR